MKKITIILILFLIIIGVFFIVPKVLNKENTLFNTGKTKFKKTKGITTVLTLEDEIEQDTIWCGTFQLIWNDLKNDLAKQDIVFNPQLKVVENLNMETFKANDLEEDFYYKKIGRPTYEFKAEIEKAIKDKFNETSDILDDFQWYEKNDEDYFLYTMLKKEFNFKKKFEELEKGYFGKYKDIKYFGIKENDSNQVREQVEVLYYNSKDDFAIKLKTEGVDEVILCKNPKGDTFNSIYKNIIEEAKRFSGNSSLQKGELLKIPNLKLKEKNEIKEIENKSFLFSNGESYHIEKAIQAIEFELDKTGGKIKSEAGMMILKDAIAIEPEEKREFLIDDTFAIFLIEEGKNNPYFAAKIDDITKFQ